MLILSFQIMKQNSFLQSFSDLMKIERTDKKAETAETEARTKIETENEIEEETESVNVTEKEVTDDR